MQFIMACFSGTQEDDLFGCFPSITRELVCCVSLSPSCVCGEWGPANINVVPFLFSDDNDRIIFEPNNS